MFLIANSKNSGQLYYDKKNGIVYRCHFRRPKPGEQTVPFSWLLAICLLISFFLLPYFFLHPFASLLFNFGSFALVICLGGIYTKRKRIQVKREGVAYVLEDLNKDELKKLEKECLNGMAIYSGLNKYYYTGMVFMLFVVPIIFFYGKHYILSFAFLLYAIELWGYDYYFTRKKHQKDYINTINSLVHMNKD